MKHVQTENSLNDKSDSDEEVLSCHGISRFHGIFAVNELKNESNTNNDELQISDSEKSTDSETENSMHVTKCDETNRTCVSGTLDQKSERNEKSECETSNQLDMETEITSEDSKVEIATTLNTFSDMKKVYKTKTGERTSDVSRNDAVLCNVKTKSEERNVDEIKYTCNVHNTYDNVEQQKLDPVEYKAQGIMDELENQQSGEKHVCDPMAILLNSESG